MLIGRTEATLRSTASLVDPSTRVSIHAASVTDAAAMRAIASAVGPWDILILNAAAPLSPSSLLHADVDVWWAQYEVSVKSVVVCAQAFVPHARAGGPAPPAIYGITSGALVLPPSQMPGFSAYMSAKMAQVKVLEWLKEENQGLFVVAVHPGVVAGTGVFESSGAREEDLPLDTGMFVCLFVLGGGGGIATCWGCGLTRGLAVELPAHFLVWLSQPKTRFLNGKLVWVHWDVEELEAMKGRIEGSRVMTIGYEGWPFGNTEG